MLHWCQLNVASIYTPPRPLPAHLCDNMHKRRVQVYVYDLTNRGGERVEVSMCGLTYVRSCV